jgi:hypothetical protein
VRNRPCFGILSPKEDTLTIKRSARRPRSCMQDHRGDRHDDDARRARLRLDRSWAEGARPRLGSGGRCGGRRAGPRTSAIFWLRDPEDKPASGRLFRLGAQALPRHQAAARSSRQPDGRNLVSFRATLPSARCALLRAPCLHWGKRTRSLASFTGGFSCAPPGAR